MRELSRARRGAKTKASAREVRHAQAQKRYRGRETDGRLLVTPEVDQHGLDWLRDCRWLTVENPTKADIADAVTA
jgi:hypothetical protein